MGHLPVLEECLSHSTLRQVVLTGTPKSVDNHLEAVFAQSTACEWKVPCKSCEHEVILDEECLGPKGLICRHCQGAIDPKRGRWVARNPRSQWGDGYWINHPMVPWMNYRELIEKRRTYDPALFKNECLGVPTILGDHIITRAELEACCTPRPMARSLADVPRAMHARTMAGVDWGGGGTSRTVLVIGYMQDNNHFVVSRMDRFAAQEDAERILAAVAQRCEEFQVRVLAADGAAHGHVYNNLLFARLPRLAGLYAMFYARSDHPPQQHRGRLWHWTIGRSASIGMVFGRVRKKQVFFPRVEDCGSYLDEICAEVAVYDDHNRTVKYSRDAGQCDDSLHALNYVVTMADWWLARKRTYGA